MTLDVAHKESLQVLRSGEAFRSTPLGIWSEKLGYDVIQDVQGDTESGLPGFILEKRRSVQIAAHWNSQDNLGEYAFFFPAKPLSEFPTPAVSRTQDNQNEAAEFSQISL